MFAFLLSLGPRKKMFVSCNSLKKNRVGRSVNNFFWSKISVLCMFYVDLELGQRQKLKGRNKNLLR